MKEGKAASDYFRFDMKPTGGPDYKAYVTRRALEETARTGESISATKYLHKLIDRDMEAQALGSQIDVIMQRLLDMDGETREIIIRLLDKLA